MIPRKEIPSLLRKLSELLRGYITDFRVLPIHDEVLNIIFRRNEPRRIGVNERGISLEVTLPGWWIGRKAQSLSFVDHQILVFFWLSNEFLISIRNHCY